MNTTVLPSGSPSKVSPQARKKTGWISRSRISHLKQRLDRVLLITIAYNPITTSILLTRLIDWSHLIRTAMRFLKTKFEDKVKTHEQTHSSLKPGEIPSRTKTAVKHFTANPPTKFRKRKKLFVGVIYILQPQFNTCEHLVFENCSVLTKKNFISPLQLIIEVSEIPEAEKMSKTWL